MVDQKYPHNIPLDHPSTIGNDILCTPKICDFPKKCFSNHEQVEKSFGTPSHPHKFFLDTYKGSKLKLTPSICGRTCNPIKAIRKATTHSINEVTQSVKSEKKIKHTIKQICDQEIFFDFDKLIESGEYNTVYMLNKKKIYYISVVFLCLLWCHILIAIIENLIHFKETQRALNVHGIYNIHNVKQRGIRPIENVLRVINMYIGLIGAVFIIVIYILRVEILKEDGYIGKNDTLFSCNLWKPCVVKAIFVFISTPPFINGVFTIGNIYTTCTVFSVNSIICSIVLMKVCFIVNLVRLFSYYSDDISKSICGNYLVKHTVLFSIKSFMNKHSLLIALLIFLYTLISFTIILLNFEYGSYQHGKLQSNVTSFLNAMWLSFSVITTLSVGDYYPVTFCGNVVCIVLGIIGFYSLTLIFFAFSEFSHFSFNEQKSYIKLKKITSGENKESKAAGVIQLLLRIRKNIMIYHNYKKDKGSVSSINISNNSSNDAQVNPHEALLTLFGMICLLKVSLTQFKNECKIAKNLGIPVDELITNMNNNYMMNVDVCIQLMDKLKYINNDLEGLISTENEIQKSLDMIEYMQKDLERYLINLNNQKVLYNLRKRSGNNYRHRNTLIDHRITGRHDDNSNNNNNDGVRVTMSQFFKEEGIRQTNTKHGSMKTSENNLIRINDIGTIKRSKVIKEEETVNNDDSSSNSNSDNNENSS